MFRVRVQPDYENADAIAAGSIFVSYTCNLRPSLAAQTTIREAIRGCSGSKIGTLRGWLMLLPTLLRSTYTITT